MKRLTIFWNLCLLVLTGWAQSGELMRIYTDKECYLAGEELWVKVCVDDAALPGNSLSKVAYVEVADTAQVYVQGKVALDDGMGWACIRFPQTMHSGIYRLTAYTRYMRNLPAERFPGMDIAVLNTLQGSDSDAMVVGDTTLLASERQEQPSCRLVADRKSYGQRVRVTLTGWEHYAAMKELTLSVVRKDCRVCLPETLAPLVNGKSEEAEDFVVECEGHIVSGRVAGEAGDAPLSATLSCVGREVYLYDGRRQPDGSYRFYTNDVYGRQDVVFSAESPADRPLHLEPLSPFAQLRPARLPRLHCLYDENELVERSIGMQLSCLLPEVPLPKELSDLLCNQLPTHSYNLDEYVRFNTVHECIIEFMLGLKVDRVDGVRVIRTMREGTKLFSDYKSLVLWDGIPVENHEAVLNYNARLVHYAHQYRNKFTFGGKTYDGVLSFITHRGNFGDMRVDEHSRMFSYEFPQNRPLFPMPEYAGNREAASRMPDYRHTLCWMPLIPADTRVVSFYTSDLPGDYVVVLRGLRPDGTSFEETLEFEVRR
ncbi:MAG: hypothetical protein IJ511_08315 [Bacteroides sp.]|nr:hypothetical protein [Bacteroides sp.]